LKIKRRDNGKEKNIFGTKCKDGENIANLLDG
jgi:hypothetical protein